jgi:hypothetical protein
MSTPNQSNHKKKGSQPSGPKDQTKEMITPIGEIPILRFGTRGNLPQFKEALLNQFTADFGRLGEFLETGRHYAPPTPTRLGLIGLANALQTQEEKDDLEWSFKNKLKAHQSRLQKIEEELPKMYGIIIRNISIESLDKVKQDPTWPVFNLSKDPLELWNVIVKTHSVGGDSTVGPVRMYAAMRSYAKLQQGATESLVAFKKRFDDAITYLTELITRTDNATSA